MIQHAYIQVLYVSAGFSFSFSPPAHFAYLYTHTGSKQLYPQLPKEPS